MHGFGLGPFVFQTVSTSFLDVLTSYADHEPNEHPGTLRSDLPRKWADLEAIIDLQVARQRQATENARA